VIFTHVYNYLSHVKGFNVIFVLNGCIYPLIIKQKSWIIFRLKLQNVMLISQSLWLIV